MKVDELGMILDADIVAQPGRIHSRVSQFLAARGFGLPAGKDAIASLAALDARDLLRIEGFGRKSLMDLGDALRRHGYRVSANWYVGKRRK